MQLSIVRSTDNDFLNLLIAHVIERILAFLACVCDRERDNPLFLSLVILNPNADNIVYFDAR